MTNTAIAEHADAIAVIGMAGYFPEANDIQAFWQNLAEGVESISRFSKDELHAAGFSETETRKDNFIGAAAIVDDIDAFDADFFHYTAHEAELLDPQQRLFLQCCWHALEQAGYRPDRAGEVGVFAGAGISTYLLAAAPRVTGGGLTRLLQLLMGNDKDYLASRVAYKLNLTGPSVCVQSACSTSLLAIHSAAQSLLNGECRMALAGGVDISVPQKMGYEYQQGMIFSPDGHCRAFDEKAGGTVAGNGAGAVVLKRFDDALADGDPIIAVIRGSAVNNDGADKIGYTAPSVQGQAKVIAQALAIADVPVESIDYIEAHGTGTALGDPIEVRALNQVFQSETDKTGFCALGSVKTNIGHLNTAAGIASFIKTVLALQHAQIPPSLHYQTQNPEIDFANSPFFVNQKLSPWPQHDHPRRAGVSSFGFGGTNVHIVLEQAPVQEDLTVEEEPKGRAQLITLSAASSEQLNELAQAYIKRLQQEKDRPALADMSFTALSGRQHYAERMALVCDSHASLQQQLQAYVDKQALSQTGCNNTKSKPMIAVLFTGQGAQYPHMARQLYQTQPVFRKALDRCAEGLQTWLATPLLDVLFGDDAQIKLLQQTAFAQPALFSVEYALYQMWQAAGVEVNAVAGHSVGEIVAACVAGVFSLEDALQLVAARGRLIQELPGNGGGMLSVFTDQDTLKSCLSDYPLLSVAAVNGPQHSVVSGDSKVLQSLARKLTLGKIETQVLNVSHAFHSVLMEPMLDEFEQLLTRLELKPPQLTIVSNLYGRIITAEEITRASYWREHLRQPVLFMDSIHTMEEMGINCFLECGPKPVLSQMGQACTEQADKYEWLYSLQRQQDDHRQVLCSAAVLYSLGVELQWPGLCQDQAYHRVSLPGYPFAKQRYWLDAVSIGLQGQDMTESVVVSSLSEQQIWKEMIIAGQQQAEDAIPDLQLVKLQQQEQTLIRLAQVFIVQALNKLELFVDVTERYDLSELQQKVLPQYHQLLQRLLEALVEAGMLQAKGKVFWQLTSINESEFQQRLQACDAAFVENVVFKSIFLQSGEQLADVLRGDIAALEAMMSDSSVDDARDIYADLPTSRYFNALIRETVNSWVVNMPADRPLRILEIGAGTGATSEQLLPLLPAERSHYFYTDVSPLFLQRAAECFNAYDFVHYSLFDINRDPQQQNLDDHSFDLIVASNVLHAASDLKQTMRYVNKLLRPGAILLMYEIVDETLIGELTTGLLLPLVKDTELRGIQPFMTELQWHNLLFELGFNKFSALPGVKSDASVLGERILLAQQAGTSLEQVDEQHLYQLGWQPATNIIRQTLAQLLADPYYWVIFADHSGQADALVDLLQAHNHYVQKIKPDSTFISMQQQLQDAFSDKQLQPVQLLYLRGLDAVLDERSDGLILQSHQTDLCGGLLNVLSALAQVDKVKLQHFSIVTCGTQRLAEVGEKQIALAQSPLWGFSQVVALGHPEINAKLVDLDPAASQQQNAKSLLQNLLAKSHVHEYQLVLRGENCYWPRLRTASSSLLPVSEQQDINIDPNGWYLIVGGLGGLGLETAAWLVGQGVTKLLLLGRSAPGTKAQEKVDKLSEQGVELRLAQLDITDFEALEEILAALPGQLKGVIHSAVVRDSAQLAEFEPLERALAVMAPKLQGAWNLHRATAGLELDFFILYSSSVSLVPARGLPEYVASNVFLDTLAYYRQAQGLPALSISWGAWSEVGTVADPQQLKRLQQGGLRSFSPVQALDYLQALLNTSMSPTHIGVLDADWSKLLKNYPEHQLRTYFSSLSDVVPWVGTRSANENNTAVQYGLLKQIESTENLQQRQQIITQYLRQRIGQLLRLPADEVPQQTDLLQLGVDSLMFLDLMNGFNQALQVQVKPNELMANLNIDAISQRLLDAVQGQQQYADVNGLLKADSDNAYQPFPLTDIQQAYWIGRDQSMDLGNVACHGYMEIDCTDLDLPLLEQAWNKMVQRHAMLRCIILPQGQQQILEQVPEYHFALLDLGMVDKKIQTEQLQNLRHQLSHRVPRTDQWPLFEVRATRLNEQLTRLHISLDNIMTDGRSIGIMLSEWIQSYRFPEQALPKLELQFRDYVMALEVFRKTPDYTSARNYWLDRLDNIYPAPKLPLAKEPSQIATPQFRRREFHLPEQQWQLLKQRGAEKAGLTPSGLLLSVYAQVLALWSQSAQFTLNVPTFSRLPLHAQVNDIVGEFTSLILLSVDYSQALPFKDRAASLQKQLLQDQGHDTFTGVQLMRELVRHTGVAEQANMPVVFTSTFGLTEQADTRFSEQEREAQQLGEQVYTISQTPQVYIDNHVHDHGGSLNVYWDCVDELFPAGVLDAMFDAYSKLLNDLVEDETIWDVANPITLPLSQRQQRQQYNATDNPDYLPVDTDLLSGFLQQVRRHPTHTALITRELTLSYEQLHDCARWLAWQLKQSGVQPGDRVALVLPKGWQQVVAVLGVLGCSGTYVPIDSELPEQRCLQLLASAQVSYVVTLESLQGNIVWPAAVSLLLLADWEQAQQQFFQASDYEFIQSTLEQLAYIIYTSGSTGMPKGVMIDHRGVLNTVLDINARFAVTADDVVFGLSALNFDLSVYDIFGTLAAGACLVLPDADGLKDPQHWLDLAEQHKITVWNSVPALCQMLLAQAESDTRGVLQNLRLVMLSGDWIPLSLPEILKQQAPQVQLFSLGGATEASIWSIYYPVEQLKHDWHSIPYGMPLANQGFHVLNAELNDCPEWVVGELYISGVGLAKGYWQDSEKTAVAFIQHPKTGQALYRTGDLGRYHPDGYIEFLGRNDHQVKINGYRIELGEIETALLGHESVKQAIVAAVDETGDLAQAKAADKRKQELIAFVVLEEQVDTGLSCSKNISSQKLSPVWKEVCAAGFASCADTDDSKVGSYKNICHLLDETYVHAVAIALGKLGAFQKTGEQYGLKSLLQHCKIQPRYEKWLNRALQAMNEKDWLSETNQIYQLANVLPVQIPQELLDAVQQALSKELGYEGSQLQWMLNTVEHLDHILTGETHSSELYADDQVPVLYQKLFAYSNGVVESLLQAMLENQISNRPLRILEIGAGLGATTRYILPLLPAEDIDYTFTDISAYFFQRIKNEFSAFSGIEYQLFDVEKDPQSQGIDKHEYDLVVAASVLHVASDINIALQNVVSLMAPGALLLLIEETHFHRWFDINMGLQTGFERYGDYQLRPEHPLLSRDQWCQQLLSAGCERVEIFNQSGGLNDVLGFDVLLAQGPATIVKTDVRPLAQFLRKKLPDYFIPSNYRVLPELPLSANGKVDRNALPSINKVGVQTKSYVAPVSKMENILVLAWMQTLSKEKISVTENFFESGGDSLLATHLSILLKQQYGVSLSVRQIFTTPVLKELAAAAEQQALKYTPLVPLSQSSGKLISNNNENVVTNKLFCFHGSDGDVFVFKHLAALLSDQWSVHGVQAAPAEYPTGSNLETTVAVYVSAIRQQQCQGPYYLCGFSSGGLLAWEAARQLQETGERVAQVILIDSGLLPNELGSKSIITLALFAYSLGLSLKSLPLPDYERFMQGLVSIEHDYQAEWLASVETITEEKLQALVDALYHDNQREKMMPETISQEQFVHRFTVFRRNVEASASYQPGYLQDIAITLLEAEQTELQMPSLAIYWQRMSDKFDSDKVAGNHFSCLQAPQVVQLAAKMRTALQTNQIQQITSEATC